MKLHDFHLVLTTEMKNNIIKLSKKFNKSMSGMVIHILKLTDYLMKKIHYFDNEDFNTYIFIKADTDLHVYMNEKDYRMIKLLKYNLNFFSMAIIVRKMIELFFYYSTKFGYERLLKILNKFRGIWWCKMRRDKEWGKYEIYKQLSHQKDKIPILRLSFNNSYQVLDVEFMPKKNR